MDPHTLRQQIKQKFKLYDLSRQYTYDQILFILDQECQLGKCDRDVARQLFDQSITSNGKANLDEIIFRYVENLQTSKLCLNREINVQNRLLQQLGNLKGSSKAYAYIKIIQISAHARHSNTPSITYKIQPSDIPPVTVVNSINPILNHEYTLQLEQDSFSIYFFESGVKIAEWTWPDSAQSIYEGEYYRNLMTENISFQLKINYKPINSHPDRKQLQTNYHAAKNRHQLQSVALEKLQQFEPFQLSGNSRNRLQKTKTKNNSRLYAFIQKIFGCLPLLRRHVRNLYYSLILLIIIECFASISWPMQFLDITIAFGIIGTLYDQTQTDLGMEMLVCMASFAFLIVKSIWGIVVQNKQSINWVVPLIFGIIVKVLCIFLAWIVSVCKEEVPTQRQYSFYEKVDPHLPNNSKYFEGEQKFDIFQ